MNRKYLLKAINIILFVIILCQAATGIGHDYIKEESFERIHSAGGIILVLFVLIHLVLNWGWIRSSYFAKAKKNDKI
ncbi:MAG: hypothetical protein AMJ90_03650 [candidate division Zixibacteria bacterium SM23_73_2]|nr:MAG: hypothetical protein AMJ90_03650 [candidate division Zixibacteria bacterium SM23_73_2]